MKENRPYFRRKAQATSSLRWAIALSSQGEAVRATPTHPGREAGSGEGGSLQVSGQGSQSLSPPPAVSDRSEGGAGPGQAVRTKPARARQADPDRPRRTPRRAEQVGHLPSSSTFFPAGSLERERVETSLRMQDLAGNKAHAQAGAPRRRAAPASTPGQGRPRTRRPGPGAEPRRAAATLDHPRAGVAGGDQGRVRSLPKVLSVLVVACRGAADLPDASSLAKGPPV